jgi:hypothetical protein
MAILLHGTTRFRAEQIAARSPDPDFVELGAGPRAEGFSTCLESGPFPLGTPEEYARRKAALFPNEGGPAILAVDVPDEIIALAVNEFFPLSQGVVQFDEGAGLEELKATWTTLWKEIRAVECP